jgi:hypothetical protein
MPSIARAPRWAGWTAAAFGLEYAASKIVMAARGELGVVGHPAPRVVTASFDGDVVAAQLGNAALGLAGVAIALALAHDWRRRFPAWLLATGAVGSLAAGIAGACVVAASLTGLREDHGQWGIDSLALAVVPLGAWVLLTAAALRDAVAVGAPRWLRASTAAAAAGCVAYGALKLSWALGGELLMRDAPLPADALRDMLAREPAWVASHWASVALAAVGTAVALGAGRLPRPLAVWLPASIGGIMLVRAGYGIVGDLGVLTGALDGARRIARADLLLWSPFFAAWGVAWTATARDSSTRLKFRASLLRSARIAE